MRFSPQVDGQVRVGLFSAAGDLVAAVTGLELTAVQSAPTLTLHVSTLRTRPLAHAQILQPTQALEN